MFSFSLIFSVIRNKICANCRAEMSVIAELTAAIAMGLVFFVSQTVANICDGHNDGDQLQNPLDCGSFYVCYNHQPKLFKCEHNLLYDPSKRVCNWAYMVTCSHLTNPITTNTPEYQTTSYTTRQPITNVSTTTEGSKPDEFYPGLLEIRPSIFHCTRPNFYFAPHPRDCEKYFMCENYRISYQQCIEGDYWDYVNNQCDIHMIDICYALVSINNPVTTTEVPEDVIECPDKQAFIAHVKDCRKYYICIKGIPIVTTCPDKMAWDNNLSQCTDEAWSKCFS